MNEWNTTAAVVTGYSNEEVFGKDYDEVLAAFGEECRSHIPTAAVCSFRHGFRAAVGEVLRKALQGTDAEQFEFPLVNRSGKRLDMLLNATARRDVHGQTMGVICVGQDITDKKNALIIEERVGCMEETLAATSHDIRTPIQSIM